MGKTVNAINGSLAKSWKNNISRVLSDVKDRSVFLNLNDSATFLTESDCLRALSLTLPDSSIRNLALKCMLDCESKSAGSSLAFLIRINDPHASIPTFGQKFTTETLKQNISKLTDSLTSEIVINSVLLAGRRGKIILDPSDFQITEISYGTQICSWKPPSDYFLSLKQQKIEVQNCKVVFIDGILETVAECHKLFNDAYEKSTPIVIFARGYSEEIIATAAINTQRKTAIVIPIVIPFDETGVNALADLASCFNSELISSDKGQLVSSISLDECKTASRISTTNLSTEIEHENNNVDDVVRKLLIKMGSCDESQSFLIKSRINALGSGSVTIKVGNDKKSLRGIQRDRIDFGLKYVRACMSSGISSYCGFSLPFLSIKSGISSADSFLSIIQNCKTVIEVDKCG